MTNTLAPGVYVLTENVKNPNPDRRNRNDWRKQVEWLKGTEFKIYNMKGFEDQDIPCIRLMWTRWTYMSFNLRDPQAQALLEKLEPAPKRGAIDLKEAMDATHWETSNAFSVLVRLLDDGIVDIENVKDALNEMNAEFDKEQEKADA